MALGEAIKEGVAMKIRVSLIENDTALREHLAALIDAAEGMECVSQHPNGAHALKHLPPANPHVALVDIRMPRLGGIECVSQLKETLPGLLAVMLTQYGEDDLIFESLKAGAVGYLLKPSLPEDICAVIRGVFAGGSPMTPEIARRVALFFHGPRGAANSSGRLTPREDEILTLVRKGYSNKEIAVQLEISKNTVANHLQSVYRKLHAQGRWTIVHRRAAR